MVVELAVCIPIIMAVLGISINLMVFLGDCARFDRLAAEVVRTRASSATGADYGLGSSRDSVELGLKEQFDESDYVRPSVAAYAVSPDGSLDSGEDGVTFALLVHQEVYECTLEYRPWGFGNSFFGIEFSGITHTRRFTIDPFRPGVLL
ncbi:MAG: hypothetical protein LBL27_03005 [Coriobacteriales bacterium]|jgi:hypothetical protein|nr:hypothetical protein [Coriobacteriales bacterium]